MTSTNTFGANTLGGTIGTVPTGTTVKFSPQTGTDTMMKNGHSQSTSINIRLMCITCMREYESKSLEELRFEDYSANRKGGSQQTGGLFGSTSVNATGGSLFGNAGATNTFGSSASTGNLFSQNKTTFGSIAPTTTTTSFFGSNNLNTNKTSFFSNPTNTTTGFGQTQPQQPSLFGNPANTSQPLGGSSFFGSNNLNTNPTIDPSKPNLFGQPSGTQSTSLFGASTAQNLAVNKPAFGATTAPFGSQPQASTSLFGNTNNTGSVFGATSQPSLFNTNTNANTALGGNKPFFNFSTSSAPSFSSGGLGTTTTTANLFGNTNSTFGTTSGSNLFGSNLGSSTFNFNSSTQPFQSANNSLLFNSNTFGNTGTGTTLGGNNFMSQPQPGLVNPTSPVNTDQIIARLQTLPYGSPQVLLDSSFSSGSVKTKFTTDPKTLNQYKINAKSQAEVKVQRVPAAGKPTTLLFDGLDDENSDNLKCAQDIFSPRPNIKKLVLNKSNTSLFKSSFIQSPSTKDNVTTPFVANKEQNCSPDTMNSTSMSKQVLDNTIDVMYKLANEAKPDTRISANTATEKSFTFDQMNSTVQEEIVPAGNYIPKCGIILSRTDYYTIPSLEECDAFYDAENDSCIVDSFTVGRVDYGSIFWNGPLNVKGINLDEIVHIRRKEVIVYPDDDAKPPIGESLNRPAQVTLDQVWPIDKATREFIKDAQRLRAMKYSEKVEAATIKLDAVFKEYRPDTGSWVFTVKHFSKYGLDADDEDVEMEQSSKPAQGEEHKGDLHPKEPLSFNSGNTLGGHLSSAAIEVLPQGQTYRQLNDEGSAPSRNEFNLDSSVRETSAQNLSNYYNYDALFHEEELEVNENTSTQLRAKNELNIMRSALFFEQDEEVDTVTKKCKNLSFTKSATSHQIIPSLFPGKIKSTLARRRKLTFEAKPSQNKANIFSHGYSGSPKVNFANGSNKFCIVCGGQVLIFDVNFLELTNENDVENQLHEHLSRNSSILPVSSSKFPPLIKTNKFCLNVGTETHLNSLIEALYGELSEMLDYCKYQERLGRIESWLFNYNKTLAVPGKPFHRIMHFLTTNELEFAVTECINSKQPRLAFLISSARFVNKSATMSQLDQWKRSESDAFIETDLLKLYILLSGQSTWTLSTGQIVDVFENLKWTQQLILLLLYKNVHIDDCDVFSTNLVKSAIGQLTVKPNVVEYHLLAQSEPWVAIAACSDLLDSWLLHESLASFNVIAEDIFNVKSDSIHLYLASQNKDLRWAVFFALHIHNDFIRYNFVSDLLVRNSIQLMDKDVERFLVDKLSVNALLISEAKLYYCQSVFDHKATAFNLIDCGQFNEAHDILTEKVFPELVINEDYKEVVRLINRLRSNQQLITNWHLYGAGVYETFIELLQFSSKSDPEKYRNLISGFNVHQLRCPTKRHFLCQSQMARVANIIHADLNNGMFAYNTSIPDDYALLELRSNAYKILEADCLSC